MKLCTVFGLLLAVLPAWPAVAQDARGPVPAGDQAPVPVLRLEGGGPLSPVSALAFGRDGTTLYEAGWDKVVRVWRRDAPTGRFQLDAPATLRVPIGPGDAGMLNALAVSSDGNWLATSGNAVLPEGAGFRQEGLIVPRSSLSDPTSQGIIYVFDLRSNPPLCRQLRGHGGPVEALAFAHTPAGHPPLLLSAGAERLKPPGRQWLVLRFWQIDGAKELDRTTAGEYRGFRPWLAAWPLAPGSNRYRAAAAWTDDAFLVWDVGTRSQRLVPDPHKGKSFVLSYLLPRGTLLTGHFGELPHSRSPEGFLNAWDAAASTRRASAMIGWRPDPANVKGTPIAQALVSSRPGAGDLLAVVLQSWVPPNGEGASGTFEYQLQLLDLSPRGFGNVRAHAPLWRGEKVQPFVTSPPDGTRLAIVGNPGNEVFVHAVDDLLRGRVEPERLGGKGEPIASASFARKGPDHWGLRIERPGRGPLILDVSDRHLVPDSPDWLPALAPSRDWKMDYIAPQPPGRPGGKPSPGRLRISQGGRPVGPGIAILPEAETSSPTDVQVTAQALLPPAPRGPLRAPIAAVALLEPGVGPTLWLHDARSGQRVRRLTGHTGKIRSLNLSDDGRLLVSAAEDRTACLWSLVDLDRIVEVRGALPGLILTQQAEGRYLVAEVRNDSPYAGRADVVAGDIITHIDEDGPGPTRLRIPRSVSDIHFTAAGRKPGQTMILRRLRDRSAPRDITLTLGQAIDGRMPLATLFLARAEQDEWLAWHPFGPYDASGEGIASLFGWHFNQPDHPEAPARFALATEYPMFRREGLLRDLFNDAAPPPAPPPLRQLGMELFLEPEGLTEGPDRLLMPRPPTRLGLALDDRVPPDRIDSVTWQLDEQAPRPMQPAGPFWPADLSGMAWDRAPHTLTVTLTTRDPAAPRFEKRRTVVYVPRPRLIPRDVTGAPETNLSVNNPRFHLALDVQPARDVAARVTLVHKQGDALVVEKPFGPYRALERLDETLDLKPGVNTIELTAVNEGAADDLRKHQMDQLGPLTVYYDRKPVERPEITLASLVLVPEEPGAGPRSRPVPAGDTDLGDVSVARIRLEGWIKAKDPRDQLLRARWRQAGTAWQPLEGFTPRLQATPFHQVLDLVPGRQQVEIQAWAGNDGSEEKPREMSWWIAYRPPVPNLDQLAVDRPGPLVEYGTPGAIPEVKLTARIVGTPERFPLHGVDVLVNGELLPTPVQPAIVYPPGSREGTLTAAVPLRPGVNPISVRLWNRWENRKVFGPVTVEYACRPRIEGPEVNVRDGRASAAVSARVLSATPVQRIAVEVAGPAGARALARDLRVVADGGAWVVSAEVPLETGENYVRIQAWNQDGPAPEVIRRIAYAQPRPVAPAPDILVENQGPTQRPVFKLRLWVKSSSPVERMDLFRERSAHARVPVPDFDFRSLQPAPDGALECPVALEPGSNTFTLEASNASGMTATNLLLTYIPPPVRVKIRGIEPHPGAGGLVELRARAEGPPMIGEPLPEADVALQGWVVRDPSYQFRGEPRIQVWVNGFPQVEVPLEPEDNEHSPERPFRARILLNRDENRIDIRLNGAPLDIHGDRTLLAICQKGAKLPRQRLHLWVIGVGVEDAATLRERALAAVNGRHYTRGNTESFGAFETPAFASAALYGPDCKDLRRFGMYGRLLQIGEQIRLNPRPSNDVVMIYYQGGEVIAGTDPELCLRLRPGTGRSRDDLFPLGAIRNSLGEARGAKLFLLDVTHTPELDKASLILSESARWISDNPTFGLLRFAWPGRPDLTATDVPPDRNLAAALGAAMKRGWITLGQVDRHLESQFPDLYRRPELRPSFNALIVGGP